MRTTDQHDAVVIGDLMSLGAWRRQLRFGHAKRLPVVEFRFPELAPEQNRCFSLLAAGYQRACGCATGRLFMSLAVAVMIGYFVSHHSLGEIELRHGLTLLAIAILAAIAGKLAGLLWARLRLLSLVTTVQRASCRARQLGTAGST